MLSFGRMRTGFFENANVTASIYCVSEHAHGSLGITRGHFAFLFSFIEVQRWNFACSSVFVWTEIFSKTLLVWMRIFFIQVNKDVFSKISGYVWTGPECSSVFVWTGIFSKALLVWTRIFIYTDKKRCVFKNIRIHVDEA